MATPLRLIVLLSALLLGAVFSTSIPDVRAQSTRQRIVIDDFEGEEVGTSPTGWKRPVKRDRTLVDLPRVVERDDDYFEIVAEGGSKRARAYTNNETTQVVRLNGEGFQWDLRTHPLLAWEWRAARLPDGAREDEKRSNDAGAAVYVTFDTDWLGRPRSIKYTYSSTLPVGETAKYGPLWVVVATSGRDGQGGWVRVARDVAEDYRRLYRRDPPNEPISITMWSDSDDTKSVSDVYFDNLELRRANN